MSAQKPQGFELSRRQLLHAGLFAAGGLMLAGCGGGAKPGGASTGPATAGGTTKLSGKVSYWHTFTSDTEFKGEADVEKLFAAQYPDVKLDVLGVPNPNFMAKITNAISGKAAPDTTLMSMSWFADVQAMGALEDITERVNQWEYKDTFPDYAWKAVTRNGKIYAVPSFMFIDWMYYRKDWAQELGLNGPPKTWDEFRMYAKKMTDPGKGRIGFSMRGGAGGESYAVLMMMQNGVKLVDDSGKPAIDRTKAVEAIKYWVELATKDKVVPDSAPNDSFNQIMTAFKTGKTGMIFHHTGSLKEIVDALGDKVATAKIPAGPASPLSFVSPSYNAMYKGVKNPDAAWKWMEFWALPDASIKFLENTGYFPANTKVAQDQRITSNPMYQPAVDALKTGVVAPSFPGYAGWTAQVIRPAVQQALLGQITPEQATDQIIAGLTKAVNG